MSHPEMEIKSKSDKASPYFGPWNISDEYLPT
jgi:hypothetical protein